MPTWGTTGVDLASLCAHPSITILPPADNIDDILCQTRVKVGPSLWAEARSRLILEAMARAIPVLASNVGGMAEAVLGMDYVLPVNPVALLPSRRGRPDAACDGYPGAGSPRVGRGTGAPSDRPRAQL